MTYLISTLISGRSGHGSKRFKLENCSTRRELSKESKITGIWRRDRFRQAPEVSCPVCLCCFYFCCCFWPLLLLFSSISGAGWTAALWWTGSWWRWSAQVDERRKEKKKKKETGTEKKKRKQKWKRRKTWGNCFCKRPKLTWQIAALVPEFSITLSFFFF